VCFQLLEEVCALGRDNSYVCQKTSAKTEQQNVFNSQSNNNGASSDDDDEDDDVASTHSGTTLKQSAPSFADPQYVCGCCTQVSCGASMLLVGSSGHRFRNNLLCIEWDRKPLHTHSLAVVSHMCTRVSSFYERLSQE